MKMIKAVLMDKKGFTKQMFIEYKSVISIAVYPAMRASLKTEDVPAENRETRVDFFFDKWLLQGSCALYKQMNGADAEQIENEGERQYKELVNGVLPALGDVAMNMFVDSGFSVPIFIIELWSKYLNQNE